MDPNVTPLVSLDTCLPDGDVARLTAAFDARYVAGVAAFAAGLKAHLRTAETDWFDGYDTDWDALDAEIDAFAAEFQRGKG